MMIANDGCHHLRFGQLIMDVIIDASSKDCTVIVVAIVAIDCLSPSGNVLKSDNLGINYHTAMFYGKRVRVNDKLLMANLQHRC